MPTGCLSQRLGKVVLPLRGEDAAQLDLLYRRARANGARVELVDEQQLHDLEPSARTATGKALFSPDTAVVEPMAIMEHLLSQLQEKGVEVRYNARVVAADDEARRVQTETDIFSYGWLFNGSGQHADRTGRLFGIGKRYVLLPFKGIYYRLSPESAVRCNVIYPVPDLNVPFLGVHYTRKLDGSVCLGPTAVPALGREHYKGFKGVEWREGMAILVRLARRYTLNRQGFRRFTHAEALRFFRRKFAEAARLLTSELKGGNLLACAKAGIRAQLLDKVKHELVMDFVVENGRYSTHVLNAISSAFTSSMSFAKYVVDQKEVSNGFDG